jgi:hypothetical protein
MFHAVRRMFHAVLSIVEDSSVGLLRCRQLEARSDPKVGADALERDEECLEPPDPRMEFVASS